MPIYHRQGEIPHKRHIALRQPDGGIYQEELMGNYGFSGPSSLLYHRQMPTQVKEVRQLKDLDPTPDPDRRLRMRHFRSEQINKGGSPTLDRSPLLFNADCAISFVEADQQDGHYFRNSDGDEYLFVAAGEGLLESPFGEIPFVEGDQLMIHRGILYRLRFKSPTLKLLVVESRGYLRWPRRYCTDQGQLKEGAPFSERDIKRPSLSAPRGEVGDADLVIKKAGLLNRVILDHDPCDVVGWDGYYYPWVFSIHDFEPITGTVHLPPPIHQVLECEGFVLCNFMPRPYDFHPEAIPAPYNHSNVMSDEVLYYASKEFMSRKGIEFGSITLHPDGLPHGPHPGRYEGSIGKPRTDEKAIMIDTFRPLQISTQALDIEDPDYGKSWLS